MAAQNAPTFYLDSGETRDSEYPNTPFQDTVSASYNAAKGCNKAGSNAPGIGIATGEKNPKTSDWSAVADTAGRKSNHIGKTADELNVQIGTDVNNQIAFVKVDAGGAADDAEADAATGALNRTGAAVVENDWIWGDIPVA